MEEKILLTCIQDPFKPIESQLVKEVDTLPSIRHAVNEFFPAPLETGFDIVVSYKTPIVPVRILTDDEIDTIIPRPGDCIVFTAVPHGGGDEGGGKNIVRAVAMLAIIVVAAVTQQYWAVPMLGMSASTVGMVGMGIAAIGGGLLINAFIPASAASLDALDADFANADYASSNTYGWNPSPNADQEGGMLPVLYGTHRITPPIVGRYVSSNGDSQFLNVLYAVCEGGKSGITSISNIEINGNPASYYGGISIDTRLGTNNQSVIPYFGDTITDIPVGVKLSTAWTVRTTTGNTVQGLGVGIVLPNGLYYANDNGGLSEQVVTFLFYYKKHTDLSWTYWTTAGVAASRNSAIREYYRINNLPPGQYDIGVLLTASLPEGSRYRNETYWEYLEEIMYDDFSYPGVALLSLNALATDQLSSSTPRVTCLGTRATVPVWTGSAYENKPATNPAWAAYDALHNDEYGGGTPYSRLIYPRFAAWAAWCDEKGYTCNVYLDTMKNLRRALDTIGTLGRGMVLQLGSKFTCIYDGDTIPSDSFLFTMGNIAKDSFAEEWLPMDDRANQIEITYYDAELNYDKQTIVLEQDGFDTLGVEVTPKQVDLVGCTSRAMAIRYGKYLLNCNKYITNTTSFTANVDSIGCIPGDIIKVAHDIPQWGYSGRIASAGASSVILDRKVTLTPTKTYLIEVQHIDTDISEVLTVEAVSEEVTTDTLSLTTSWENIPAQYSLYSFGQEDRVKKLFRVINITQAQNMARKITAIEHVLDVYNDDATVINITGISDLPRVKDLSATEIVRVNRDGSTTSIVSLTWHGAAFKWSVYISDIGLTGPWTLIGETGRPFFEVSGLAPGKTYAFSVSGTHNAEDGKTTSILHTGEARLPDVPSNLNAYLSGDTIVLTWAATSNVTVVGHNVYLNDTLIVSSYAGNRYVYKGLLTPGNYPFKITAVNGDLEESGDSDRVTVAVFGPTTPSPSSATTNEIMTLSWADCTASLPIRHYLVNGVSVGTACKYSQRISWTGAQSFTVQAIDVAGNESSAATIDVTITVIPTPTGLTATGQVKAIRLDITHELLSTKEVIEIWESDSNNRASAVHMGDTPATSWLRSGLPLIASKYYWCRIKDIYGNLGPWYPASATGGIPASTSMSPSDYLSVLMGSITEDQLYQDLNNRIDWIDTESFIFDDNIIEPDIYNGIAGAYSGLYNIAQGHQGTLNSLLATAAGHANDIIALQSEVASLTTSDWSATGDYTLGKYVVYNNDVYRCIQAYTHAVEGTKTPGIDTAYWEAADALSTLVSSIETRVDSLEGEILLKVSTTTFNALQNRVSTNESSISQNTSDILLRVAQTEFDSFSAFFLPEFSTGNTYSVNAWVQYNGNPYKCKKIIDFTPAPLPTNTEYWELVTYANAFTTYLNQVDINTDGISLMSSTITGDIAYLFDSEESRTFETDIYVESAGDVRDLDIRLTQAGMDIDGAEAAIALHASLIDGLTGRVSQAEIDIDGTNAQIALKASQANLEDTNERITSAEIAIDGHSAALALKASQTDLTTLTGRVSTAESNIAAGQAGSWASITSKATVLSVSALDSRVSTAESDIDSLQSTVGGHTTSISQAQSDINAGKAGTWASILSKATTADVDAIDARIDIAESDIDTLQSTVGTHATAISQALSDIMAGKAGSWASISDKLLIASYTNDQKDVNSYLRVAALENRFAVYDTTDAPTWNNYTSYNPGTIVVFSGIYYRSTRTSLNKQPPNATYWIAISEGLLSQWTLKLNAQGRVAGVGLMLDGSGSSEFIVLADKFQVVDPSDTLNPKAVFTVGTINGETAVGIDGDLIVDGTLNAGRIGAGDINITWDGNIRGGATDYLEGKGFFLGYSNLSYKFFVGDPDNKYIAFDGSNLSIGRNVRLMGTDNYGDQHIFLHERPLHYDMYIHWADWVGTSRFGHGIPESYLIMSRGECTLGVYAPNGYTGVDLYCGVTRYLPETNIQDPTWTKARQFVTRIRYENDDPRLDAEIVSGLTKPVGGHADNTECHFGFRFIGGTLYGSCGNGHAGTKIALGVTAGTYNQIFVLEAKFTPGTGVEFFVNEVFKGSISTNTPGSAAGHEEEWAEHMISYSFCFIRGDSTNEISACYEFSDYKILQD